MTSLQTIATKIAACLCRELIDDWHMDVDARRQLVQIRRKQIDDVAINGNGDYILDQNGIKIEVDEEPRLVEDAVGISMWRGPSPAKRRVVGRGPNTGKRNALRHPPTLPSSPVEPPFPIISSVCPTRRSKWRMTRYGPT